MSAQTTTTAGLRNCGDCAAEPGKPHSDGCDVARCTLCGWQRISCEHEDNEGGWGHIWTGRWPGVVECEELGFWTLDLCQEGRGFVTCTAGTPGATADLNKLAAVAGSGFLLTWDGSRWQPVEEHRDYLAKVAAR